MALMGLKRESRRMGFKNKSAGPWDEGKPERKHGVGKCGHYDTELDAHGYCRASVQPRWFPRQVRVRAGDNRGT